MLIDYQPMLVLAQSRIEAMNQAFRSQQSGNGLASLIMLGIVGAILAFAAVIFIWFNKRSGRHINDPHKLFAELCRTHGLSGGQRRLLLELAAAQPKRS